MIGRGSPPLTPPWPCCWEPEMEWRRGGVTGREGGREGGREEGRKEGREGDKSGALIRDAS